MDSPGPFRFQNLQSRKPALMSRMARTLIHSQLGRLQSRRMTPTTISPRPNPVSYTHLDVYKRQLHEVIRTWGGKSPEEAAEYVADMKKHHRYQRDVY